MWLCVCVYFAIPHSLHKFSEWWCVVNKRKSVHYRAVLHFSLSVDDSIWCAFVLLSVAARFRNAKILNSIPTGGFPTSVFNGINIFISPMPHPHTQNVEQWSALRSKAFIKPTHSLAHSLSHTYSLKQYVFSHSKCSIHLTSFGIWECLPNDGNLMVTTLTLSPFLRSLFNRQNMLFIVVVYFLHFSAYIEM